MGIERQQCPKCGNWVEGKKQQAYTKKIAKAGVKTAVNSAASVGAASTGAAIGTAILPGVGTLIGGAAGFLASTMFHTAVNDGIDMIADGAEEIFSDNIQYEYTCPKCGYTWSNLEHSSKSHITSTINKESTSFQQQVAVSDSDIRTLIFNEIKQCTKVPYLNEGNSLTFIGLNSTTTQVLKNKLSEKYGISILETTILSCTTVRELIDAILRENLNILSSSTQSNNQSELDYEQQRINEEQEQFNKHFDYLFDEKDKIIKNEQTAKSFIINIGTSSSSITNNVIRSEYCFLQALCCFYYTVEHDGDKSFTKQGEEFIDKAQQYYYDDEYTVFKLIFKSYNLNHEDPNIVLMQEKISQSCPDILILKNTLLKCEYLLDIYNNSRFYSLLDSCICLEKKIQYREAEQCWIMMTQLSDNFSKLVGNYFLYKYYLSGIGEIEESAEKYFFYCKNVVDLYDLDKEFDKDNSWHQNWLECLSILGSCYLEGDGTNVDYRKGFDLSLRAALLGDQESMLEVGKVYEKGKGIYPNLKKAIEWYQKAANLGVEEAQQKLKELQPENSYKEDLIQETSTETTISISEQEYLEEVKACMEEDTEISPKERRLLNRLRDKLGISEIRAQELEASLLKPQLTTEEQEYIEEYKACLEEDNVISEKERRLLEKLRKMLGISEERAKELESI